MQFDEITCLLFSCVLKEKTCKIKQNLGQITVAGLFKTNGYQLVQSRHYGFDFKSQTTYLVNWMTFASAELSVFQ